MPTRNPFAAKVGNPFAANPLTTADAVVLLEAPPPPQELEPRTPLKAFLAKGGGGLGDLLDALGGPAKRRAAAAPSAKSDADADLAAEDPLEAPEQPLPPPPADAAQPPKWGRR